MREAGLSKRIVCAAPHTNCDRPSACIHPSMMAGQLADDDIASKHSLIPNHVDGQRSAHHDIMINELQ